MLLWPEHRKTSPKATLLSIFKRVPAETVMVTPTVASCGSSTTDQLPLAAAMLVQTSPFIATVTFSPGCAEKPKMTADCGPRCSTMLSSKKDGNSSVGGARADASAG